MTTPRPGPSGDGMVKGLAKPWSRLHHGREAKCVDAGPSQAEGSYSPMTGGLYLSDEKKARDEPGLFLCCLRVA